MLLFAAAGGAVLFEAVGVLATQTTTGLAASIQDLEPITHYVRCAIYYDKVASHGIGYWTFAMIGLGRAGRAAIRGHLRAAEPARALIAHFVGNSVDYR